MYDKCEIIKYIRNAYAYIFFYLQCVHINVLFIRKCELCQSIKPIVMVFMYSEILFSLMYAPEVNFTRWFTVV